MVDIKIKKATEHEIPVISEDEAKILDEDIKTPENDSDKKIIIIVALVIIGLFVLPFAGYYAYDFFTSGPDVINIDEMHELNLEGDLSEEEGYMYNGFSFVNVDGLWWTNIVTNLNGERTLVKIPLHFGPKDVKNIESVGQLSDNFNEFVELLIAIDPDVQDKYYTLALSELSFNVAKGIERIPVGACTKDYPVCVDRPIVSCENNPTNLPIIELVLNYSLESSIEMQGSCIKLSGSDYGIVKAADRLLLEWYGVMS
jgi:hypothetical protein